ncbi:MAG: 23S rRNA (pseudouridine(1915)-N(3))-methyltransferase RlmH [Panacagrimonas sp.]
MKLRLVAVGTRMPAWVTAGFDDYVARLPRELRLELVEIPLAQRGKNADLERAKTSEGEKLLERSREMHRVMLDERGASWTSIELAGRLKDWMQQGRAVALLVGGPDGYSAEVPKQSAERWSLSKLTLPHALVRILVAEQIYRAWSLTANHPYHRA